LGSIHTSGAPKVAYVPDAYEARTHAPEAG
jgi:hypothetical protein